MSTVLLQHPAAIRVRARVVPAEPPRYAVAAVTAAIAFIPLVAPRLPGNSGPADVVIAIAIFATALWLVREGSAMVVPFALGWGVLMTAGALSGLIAGRPGDTLVVVVQETHLLLFGAAIATVARTPRVARTLRAWWTAAAVGWSVLLIAAVALGIGGLVKASAREGTRAQLFFQNPNITGSYFMVSFFVAVSTRWPKRAVPRAAVRMLLLAAVFLTGSNAAIFGTAIGGAIAAAWWLWHRRDPAAAMLFIGLMLVAAAVGSRPLQGLMAHAHESEQAVVRYSIGRFERSAGKRQELFASQVELYRQTNFMGIGPFATRDQLGAQGESGVRSSHNDYLATMVERGPVGIAGLILLAGAIGYQTVVVRRRRENEYGRANGTGAAAIGAILAIAVSALTHETLHYRHLWALLGLIAAVHHWSRINEPEADR